MPLKVVLVSARSRSEFMIARARDPCPAQWRFVMSPNPADYGTAEEAKAMLERAVAAVKENKAKALDMFNKGEGGFKDRDLYVYCANASDGIFTAHPMLKGKQ